MNNYDDKNNTDISVEDLSSLGTIIGKVLGIVGVSVFIGEKIGKGISMINKARDFKNDTQNNSVTKAAKPSVIVSRVFIDDALKNDTEVLVDVLGFAHILYSNLIMITLDLNNFVSSGKTVSDVLKPISYENNKPYVDLNDYIDISLENDNDNKHNNSSKPKYIPSTKSETKEVEQVAPNILPVGKVLTYNLKIPTENGDIVSYPITLMVQMTPYYIATNILEDILGEKTNLTWTKRFIQLRVGEISFWKDFLFNIDILKENQKRLKADKTGAYNEYLNMVDSKNKGYASKFTDIIASMIDGNKKNLSQNLANTVFIINKNTIDRVKDETGIDLYKSGYREKFFSMSYAMFLLVLDDYGEIDIMLNGYDKVSHYQVSQLKSKKKSMNADIAGVLSQLASGNFK